MKTMLVAATVAVVSGCAGSAPVMVGSNPGSPYVYDFPSNPVTRAPTQDIEVPKATNPVVVIDDGPSDPMYIKGEGVGGEVAHHFLTTSRIMFERSDYEKIEKAAHQAILLSPTGEAVDWSNASTGRSGYVKVLKSMNKLGKYCRQFESEIRMKGGAVVMDDTACQTSQGTWFLLKD